MHQSDSELKLEPKLKFIPKQAKWIGTCYFVFTAFILVLQVGYQNFYSWNDWRTIIVGFCEFSSLFTLGISMFCCPRWKRILCLSLFALSFGFASIFIHSMMIYEISNSDCELHSTNSTLEFDHPDIDSLFDDDEIICDANAINWKFAIHILMIGHGILSIAFNAIIIVKGEDRISCKCFTFSTEVESESNDKMEKIKTEELKSLNNSGNKGKNRTTSRQRKLIGKFSSESEITT